MKRAAVVRGIRSAEQQPPKLRAVPRASANAARLPALGMARVHEISEAGVVLAIGGELVPAKVDPAVHPVVIQGACARHERVLVVEDEDGALVVLGALRTQPTPGIDVAESYEIKAKRVTVEVEEELSLKAQTAALVLRAVGEVETYAERIVSRAEGIHKIVGRMLRLN